jgi:hypothetical protein
MSETRNLQFTFPLMRGQDVRAVQQALSILNTTPSCGTIDGIFGNATRQAVMAFQATQPGLAPDGVVGPLTREVLLRLAIARQTPTPAAPGTGTAAPLAPVSALVRTQASKPPLSRAQALTVRDWMVRSFGPSMDAAVMTAKVAVPELNVPLLCAIAAKETGPEWALSRDGRKAWTETMDFNEVLARCVFDASGDFPGAGRVAFPRNTEAFRARFGKEDTEMLIDEANKTRRLRGMEPQSWVYKGYGLWQYDLQHIDVDPDYFLKKQWGNLDICLNRLMKELTTKSKAARGDLRGMVRGYNGQGEAAENYADHVLTMYKWML